MLEINNTIGIYANSYPRHQARNRAEYLKEFGNFYIEWSFVYLWNTYFLYPLLAFYNDVKNNNFDHFRTHFKRISIPPLS